MAERAEPIGTVVIGAGQAGLANSRELARHGLGHIVLERGRIGEAWRARWYSLCATVSKTALSVAVGLDFERRDFVGLDCSELTCASSVFAVGIAEAPLPSAPRGGAKSWSVPLKTKEMRTRPRGILASPRVSSSY
jgi:choline dehydrogenase-like flavoprotein